MLDASIALKTEGRVVNAKKVVSYGPFVEGRNVVRRYVNWAEATRSLLSCLVRLLIQSSLFK